MNKFKAYLKDCKGCVEVVKSAIDNNVVLSHEESLDYYFKILCNYRVELKSLRNSDYKLAYFYSKVMKILEKISIEGYTNDSAVSMFKKINRYSKLLLGSGVTDVVGYDENGSLFIEISKFNWDYFYSFKVKNIRELANCLVDFSSILVENFMSTSEFCSNYMKYVLSDVLAKRTPVPYTNMCEDKILSYEISKKANITKVVNFGNIGGNRDGRCNERDIEKRRAVAGI